jgi:GR25 family glycosyltransferase involved in LPS biosynthesis
LASTLTHAQDWESGGWTELARQAAEGELAGWAELTPTEVAISRSHFLAWTRLAQQPPGHPASDVDVDSSIDSSSSSPPKYALVLEDDVEVTPHFVQALNRLHAAAAAAAAAAATAEQQQQLC